MSLLDKNVKTCFSQISLGIIVMENGAVLQTLFDILKYFRTFTEYILIYDYFLDLIYFRPAGGAFVLIFYWNSFHRNQSKKKSPNLFQSYQNFVFGN